MGRLDMSDVAFGEPREDYRPESISRGLRDIADWFDVYDDRGGVPTNDLESRIVQTNLREWATEIETMQDKLRQWHEWRDSAGPWAAEMDDKIMERLKGL